MDRLKVILEAQPVCMPEPRGTAYYALQVIRRLLNRDANDYELTFFDGNREMNNRSLIDKYFGSYDVPIHECNAISYRETFKNKDLYREKSYNDYTGTDGDVYHFLNIVSVPGKLRGKMVVTMHDVVHIKHPGYFAPYTVDMVKFNLNYLKRANPMIITSSAASKEDICYFTDISEDKVFVIPASYDEESCLPAYDMGLLEQMDIKKPYLLFLSANAKNKNLGRIIEAFEQLAERHPDFELILAGGDAKLPDAAAMSKIQESRFNSRIRRVGYVSDAQKHALYSNALVFLFPSLFEGFGLPVLEAMARGCPVITSNTSSLPEVAGNAAIMIDPCDTQQLAYEMQRAVLSEALREELKLKGFEQCKKFSWDKTAEMTEAVYKVAMDA